jgi:hypothetical protein
MDSTTRPGTAPAPDPVEPEDAPTDLLTRLRDLADEPTRAVEFALGTVVFFLWVPPGVPAALALGLVAVAALVGVASLRRPVWGLAEVRWLVPATLLLLSYLTALSAFTPDGSISGWEKRALRLALVAALLVSLVSGRLHLPSVVRGAVAGLAVNSALFYAGLAPALYGSYLSGYLLDKNVAGMVYAVVGLLSAGLARTTTRRYLMLVATIALVWGSGSRTSLAALACGLAWFVLRPHLGVFWRLALAAALAYAVRVLEVDYARVGVFAERAGSDELRARIDAASQAKLDLTPWYGEGLGAAWVPLQDGNFYFHSSYWSALVEGGWILLAAYLLVTVWFGIGPLRRGRPVARWASAAEAANVVVLVCALRLGEVFGTTAAVVALAAGLLGHVAYRLSRREGATSSGAPAGTAPVTLEPAAGGLRTAP